MGGAVAVVVGIRVEFDVYVHRQGTQKIIVVLSVFVTVGGGEGEMELTNGRGDIGVIGIPGAPRRLPNPPSTTTTTTTTTTSTFPPVPTATRPSTTTSTSTSTSTNTTAPSRVGTVFAGKVEGCIGIGSSPRATPRAFSRSTTTTTTTIVIIE